MLTTMDGPLTCHTGQIIVIKIIKLHFHIEQMDSPNVYFYPVNFNLHY